MLPQSNHPPWPPWPQADERTLDQIQAVLQSGRWAISAAYAEGPSREHLFSQRFAAYHGVAHCVTLDHGTSALIAALEALDIGYGDEVIVPGLTWIAPAIAVLSVNAIPVCVDVEKDTFCIDPDRIAEAITSRTRAIIPIHMYGCMVDMDRVVAMASHHGLAIIEDAAHSHGSKWRDRMAGTMGQVGVFSLQQGKPLTCGEGGAAITADADLKRRIENSAWNGRRRLPPDQCIRGNMQLVDGDRRFGTNRCLSEFQAAILLDQLDRLDAQIARREENARWLDDQFKEIPGVLTMLRRSQVTRQSYYGYVLRIEPEVFGATAQQVIARLQPALKMGNFLLHAPYPPMTTTPLCEPHPRRHALPIYERKQAVRIPEGLPNAEYAHRQAIVLHHSVLLAEQAQLASIVTAMQTLQQKGWPSSRPDRR